jgi:hypothetical protein
MIFLQKKSIVLTFLSSIVLFGCGTQSYSNYKPSSSSREVVSEPSSSSREVVSEPSSPSREVVSEPSSPSREVVSEPSSPSREVVDRSSQSSNAPNYAQLEFTPEEIEVIRQISKLTDEQIASTFPSMTPDAIQLLRSLSRTLPPEQTATIQPNQPPQTIYPQQTPSTSTLEDSNRRLAGEMRRLRNDLRSVESDKKFNEIIKSMP